MSKYGNKTSKKEKRTESKSIWKGKQCKLIFDKIGSVWALHGLSGYQELKMKKNKHPTSKTQSNRKNAAYMIICRTCRMTWSNSRIVSASASRRTRTVTIALWRFWCAKRSCTIVRRGERNPVNFISSTSTAQKRQTK